MSNVNIKRAVENIRANTTVYTPIVEVVVNAIQAIERTGRTDGSIKIRACRTGQTEADNSLPEIHSFEIEDNGIGFTEINRESFDTLFGDLKIEEGGKGFGRFICLKYFHDLYVDSVFRDKKKFTHRKFSMGKEKDIIVNEETAPSEMNELKTVIRLSVLKKEKSIDKKLTTIARNLVEKLLPYFITEGYTCPDITLSELNGTGSIRLNDYFDNELSSLITEISTNNASFKLKGIERTEKFLVRVFKLYFPKSQKSKISLVAHKREVAGSAIHDYIPEFVEDFYDKDSSGNADRERNYIIKAYVFGQYLDRNVSLERGGFEFKMESDLLLGISQTEIERKSANIAKEAIGSEIKMRQEKKKERVHNYVEDEAPWHKNLLNKIDLTKMPYNPSNEEIEGHLQKEKYSQETQIKKEVANLLTQGNLGTIQETVSQIVSKIAISSKDDLIHYIALRRNILDIFEKSLGKDKDGSYSSEGVVHDIVFPRKDDTTTINYEDHNLWIIDERLNFTKYVSSDLRSNRKQSGYPDLLVYNKRVLFRGDNEASNPITIFEFKKPYRDDFVNPSSKEDPIQQIVRYVNDIRDGLYQTPEGMKLLIAENTPYYGFVVCSLTPKVEAWLDREKDFKPMPDRLGWFRPMNNINLYIEVLSWDKVLKDAKMRNQIFFKKLGI